MADEVPLRLGLNSAVLLSNEYRQVVSQLRMFEQFLDTCTDVVITGISDDGKRVDCKSISYRRKENGEDLPQMEYTEIPICSFSCSSGRMRFKVSVGDVGILIARKYDISMPESDDNSPKLVESGRVMSFSQGFFVPISFCGNPAVDFELTSGNVSMNISGGVVNIIADTINLGSAGGKKVALDGDPVVSGKVVASSTKVKAV